MNITTIISHFWSRWSKEYLTALREFHHATGNNVQTAKEGDVVQIHDELNKGADGLVRSAQLRTSTGRTNHPIAKLHPLEVMVTDTLPSRSDNLT